MFRGSGARSTGVGLLVVAGAMAVTSLVLWFGLGDARGADARTVIVLGIGVAALLPLVLGVLQFRAAARQDRILAGGIAGLAAVQSVTQTGMRVNGQPEVELRLLVRVPGGEPYPATVKEIVPFIALGRLADAELPVRVDPGDAQAVVIDWAQRTTEPDPGPG
jgi:hypothetical protein